MKLLILPFVTSLMFSISSSSLAGEVAHNPTHVVELFTSQGCSSCPKANRFVSKLAKDNPSTLVLSYGVTYWDYLGWADTFGDPEFTQRQEDYRDAFEAANVYTPQIVLGGSAHSPRYSKRDVAEMNLPETDVNLSLTRTGNVLTLNAETDRPVLVDVVSFIPGEQTVDVKRGENGGRTLTLTNVVTDVLSVDWNGTSATVTLPRIDGRQYAALVHDRETAKILDAAVIN